MKISEAGRKKEARSSTISVRLEPKYRYLAEIAARRQRRTLSSFLEWAVEDVLKREIVIADDRTASNLADEANYLWSVDPAERFSKLASRFESLLNHEEQILWKVIDEISFFWDYKEYSTSEAMEALKNNSQTLERRDRNGNFISATTLTGTGPLLPKKRTGINLTKLRKHWPQLIDVAKGALSQDSLMSMIKEQG